MKRIFLLQLLAACLCSTSLMAQVVSSASFLKARPKADVVVPYRVLDEGVETPIEWGLDLAWLSEDNVKCGVMYAGKDLIDIVRTSYRASSSVADGALSDDQLEYIKKRYDIIKRHLKSGVGVNINNDHGDPVVIDSWYNSGTISSDQRGKRYAQVIDLTIKEYRRLGMTNLVSISPFNEPDYGWGQGYSNSTRKADFLGIAKSLKNDFDGAYDQVRICGGNTLNDDKAYEWWNYLKGQLDEGNTHQLAGDFAHYADFFKSVRDYGHHATADELHNTMEAMVGVEYGMQTGIWWGTCEYTRSQFMKATYHRAPGKRLAYGEHRDNWTAAALYRHKDGRMQLFGGTSERQAKPTTYNFASIDRPVWVNGEPGREYVMYLHGGDGYQNGQTNAEKVLDVQSGRDIMPHINGTYRIMNVNSGRLLGTDNIYSSDWHTITQRGISSSKALQWIVEPFDDSKSGDLSYCFITQNTGKNMTLDILNWNLNAGADVGVFPGGLGTNEQWYLEYAGEGAFYIRSRFSTKYLEVANSSTATGANIQMGNYTGYNNQKWRFIAVDTRPELVAPDAPTALTATSGNASVHLNWKASTATDVAGYTILRSEDGEDWYTIAKGVADTVFVDNEALDGVEYSYQVYAVDKCYNYSECSNAVSAAVTGDKGLVMHLPFEYSINDTTENGNHGSVYGLSNWYEGKMGQALSFGLDETGTINSAENFLQLPYTVANHDEMTIACWVYWKGGSAWQRIWDFGTGTEQYMFFSPSTDRGMRFAIKNKGDEQQIRVTANFTKNKWTHVAVTLGSEGAVLYINGVEKARNADVNIKPSDITPVFNYIGRSQFAADPNFSGYIDDFRIYNYPLSAEELQDLVDTANGIEDLQPSDMDEENTIAYDLTGKPASSNKKGVVLYKGRKVIRR